MIMDWQNGALGALGGLGQIGGGLYGLFGSKNPAQGAQGYYNQIPGTVAPYYNPYIQAGQGALGQYGHEAKDLINDPSGVYNKLTEGYKQSPGYQFALEQALGAGKNAAAAGGMLGSPQHEQQSMQIASDIASQDFNNYLNAVSGLYGQGMSGLGNISQLGYGASTGLGDMLGGNLAQQGGLNFAGQQWQNQNRSSGAGNILGGLGSLLASFLPIPGFGGI